MSRKDPLQQEPGYLESTLRERELEMRNRPVSFSKLDDRLWPLASATAARGIRPDGAILAQYRAYYNYGFLGRENQAFVTVTNNQRNLRRNVYRTIPL